VVHHVFPGRLQGRGQALYSGVSYGVGGALGSLLSGYSWESLGATWTFMASAGVAILGLVLSWWLLKRIGDHYA
jgi:PPP family 3-phenylpropionic acid transporter